MTRHATDDPNRTESIVRSHSRRALLATTAGTLATGLAGCLDGVPGTEQTSEPESGSEATDVLPDLPRVDNPPDAVYIPTHREAMEHLPTQHAGEFAVTPMLTYPHRFWLVTGQEAEEVLPESARGVHLMFTPWDPETNMVLPVDSGAEMRVSHDGAVIDQRAPWPMISQSMGFHFGDNVPLPEDGTYTVEIDLNPISTQKTGGFADRFEEGATATFEFEYDDALRNRLIDQVHYFDEELWGEPGAIDPMDHGDHGDHGDHSGHTDHDEHEDSHDSDEHGDHDSHDSDEYGDHDSHDNDEHGDHDSHDSDDHMGLMPFSRLPEATTYPGIALGEPRTGDARVVVRLLRSSRLADGDDYLLVSPRTPHNAVPLADTAISVAGGIEGRLTQTLDDELGLHYGTAADLDPGDDIEIQFDSPPQVSRHAGYETAFIEMPPVTVTVPE